MDAHLTMRTYYGVNKAFRFRQGIWVHRKSRQIRLLFLEKAYFTLFVRNIFRATILYKYHAKVGKVSCTLHGY